MLDSTKKLYGSAIVLVCLVSSAFAEEIGSVDTAFVFLGANHKIVIEAFDDPKVPGVSCHLSRAKTGGVKGTFGIAEDTSDASIACRQTGIITLPQEIQSKKSDGERVFRESTSLLFKHMQVVRFYDVKRNTLIYLTYSDKLIDGSPKNSISTVQITNSIFEK
ncbi:CreA family protein [Sulfurospirillum diekertiae]|uniref:CreA family protein n=1 Tax=Sulfurospirillum diekertiae TaxID=1854492 RepID=A0A290HUU4_9BACT|nr:CreA family protein [Sulfurospirillum diekertiae]ATB69139.1 CreA family protein [Sulfurospirillum diekertiae]